MSESENFLIDGWEDDEYRAFVDKFKAKKTSDDCYTPDEIYDAVAAWVEKTYGQAKAGFVRPFWPGGDFEKFDYPDGCVVVDNPPFSIMSSILRFYHGRGIRFFLFAPALTLFSSAACDTCAMLPVGVTVTYANGAEVPTSFLTNLEPEDVRVKTAPELYRLVDGANRRRLAKRKLELPKYIYPDHILTAAIAQRWCKYGVEYELKKCDSVRVSGLESQKPSGASIFGGGFLLSTRAAAERAAAERAAAERAAAERAAASVWELTDTERWYVAWLDNRAVPYPPTLSNA